MDNPVNVVTLLDLKSKIILILVGLLTLGILIFVAYDHFQQQKYSDQIRELNNKIAEITPAFKIAEGAYQKLMMDNTNLNNLVKAMDKSFGNKLDDLNLKVLQVSNSQIEIKDQVFTIKQSSGGKITQTTIPIQSGTPMVQGQENTRIKVEFDQQRGYFGVKGYTLSTPPEAYITVYQSQKLNIITGVVRDKDGKYSTIIQFPQDFPIQNINVVSNIDEMALCNKYTEKWYNRVYVGGNLYVSKNGIIIGPGIGYEFMHQLGLGVSVMVDSTATLLYGLNVSYKPFSSGK